MNSSDDNNNSNDNNNIPKNAKEAGTDYNLSELNNNNKEHEIDINIDNIINFENNNNINLNLNQNLAQNEEEEEIEEEEENESNNNNSNSNNYKFNQLIPTENFSQQVDFLFHPKNPEWQTAPVPPEKKIKPIIKKSNSKQKINKTKKKSKNKFRGGFGIKNNNINNMYKKNKKIENRPEFDLCTKIESTPKKNKLSLFYGTKGDTRYEKQMKIREQKIEQYEEDFLRRKEIYKAKRQRENFELKKNYMNQKYKTSNNFYPKKNSDNNDNKDYEFLKQLNNLKKINYPNTNIRNYECNPQKYDIIIHSLLSEISQIKLQREKENRAFEEQIKKLQDDNITKKRPKSGIKNKINNNGQRTNNSVCKNIKKYFDKNNKKKKRPLTSNKYNIKTVKKIENEIPVSSAKKDKNNIYYKNTKDKIREQLKELEMQKQNKLNEILELQNNKNYYNNNINNNISKSINNINYINEKNINPVPNIQNISNSQNIIFTGPQYLNFSPSINTHILNYQDKAQILTELNNNIAKFTSGIPKLINKVNEAVNKIYGNTENPIKKAINNHPFVILAAKATHQTIEKYIDIIVENIVDDLITELKDDLDDIDEKEKKYILMNNFMKAQMKLNALKQDEINILKKYLN